MSTEFNNTVAEVDLFKKLKDPTNPYTMYNNQDRFLNAVYRPFTTGELEKLYYGWGTVQYLRNLGFSEAKALQASPNSTLSDSISIRCG